MLRNFEVSLSLSAALRRRRSAGLRRLAGLWLGRRRQRLALRELEPRLLDDVGLTPAQAAREAAKPFWRA